MTTPQTVSMNAPALELEVVALIRRMGPQDAGRLHVHLPQVTVEKVQQALEKAEELGYLRGVADGHFAYVPPKPPGAADAAANDRYDPERDAAAIVRQALHSRSDLELAWFAPAGSGSGAWAAC